MNLARNLRGHIALACSTFLVAVPAHANLVANGSFESVTATVTSIFSLAGVSAWTNSGNASLSLPEGEALVTPAYTGTLFPNVGLAGPFPPNSPDGGNFVLSDGDFFNSPIKQTVGGLVANQRYKLSFYQALAQDTEPGVTLPGPVTGRWQVSFGPDVQLSSFMAANGATPTISPWKQETMVFTAHGASQVLQFLSVGTGDPPMVALDGIRVTAVPEPGSWLLMGLGGAALVLALRRRTGT